MVFLCFFQACREVIKVDIMGVFHDFHARSKLGRSLIAMFIALIPKKFEAIFLTY